MRRRKVLTRPRKIILALSVTGMIFAVALFGYVLSVKQMSDLSFWQIYQNIANPSVRYVKITEGMRQEEVADRFAKTLGWSASQRQQLITSHALALAGKSEGYFYPTTYLISTKATPQEVSGTIVKTFNDEVVDTQKKLKSGVLNTDTIIKIASIIQREAGGKQDMRIISGIIWNRLFQGMNLDIDATLQYAKGTDKLWWPTVKPIDKKIDSPYNTYKNKGLPPAPISNPGDEAIKAALNPISTKALFYLHDKQGNIHTAVSYAQHVANVETYY